MDDKKWGPAERDLLYQAMPLQAQAACADTVQTLCQ